MNKFSIIMHAKDTTFNDDVCITLTKLHGKFQYDSLKIFQAKEEKVQKKVWPQMDLGDYILIIPSDKPGSKNILMSL